MTTIDRAVVSALRVLIVDDSSLVRMYYRDVLEKAGFEVDQAMNGLEAMEKALAGRFDLLIVDVNMPKMDGFSFLRELRRSGAPAALGPGTRHHDRGGRAGRAGGADRRRELLSRQAGRGERSARATSRC